MDWNVCETTLNEIIQANQSALLQLARRIIPSLTSEDILQPNDYPELENHPEFRYAEGVLAGLLTAQVALRAVQSERIGL